MGVHCFQLFVLLITDYTTQWLTTHFSVNGSIVLILVLIVFYLVGESIFCKIHCVKSVQMRSFFWSAFSRIRTENGEIRSISSYSVRYLSIFSPNAGKYGPEKTPYLDIFHAVILARSYSQFAYTCSNSTITTLEKSSIGHATTSIHCRFWAIIFLWDEVTSTL